MVLSFNEENGYSDRMIYDKYICSRDVRRAVLLSRTSGGNVILTEGRSGITLTQQSRLPLFDVPRQKDKNPDLVALRLIFDGSLLRLSYAQFSLTFSNASPNHGDV
jgi:hypothetical protein